MREGLRERVGDRAAGRKKDTPISQRTIHLVFFDHQLLPHSCLIDTCTCTSANQRKCSIVTMITGTITTVFPQGGWNSNPCSNRNPCSEMIEKIEPMLKQ